MSTILSISYIEIQKNGKEADVNDYNSCDQIG